MPNVIKTHVALLTIAIIVSLPLYPFQWHLLFHIFGAIIFLGNIIVSAVWMVLAQFTRDAAVINFAARSVNRADLFFTVPAVILLLLNGLALANLRWGGWSEFHNTGWIMVALGLFVLSGLIAVGLLMRYQRQLDQLSASAVQQALPLPAEFWQVPHKWYFWGTIATILPLLSLYLMVYKPELW